MLISTLGKRCLSFERVDGRAKSESFRQGQFEPLNNAIQPFGKRWVEFAFGRLVDGGRRRVQFRLRLQCLEMNRYTCVETIDRLIELFERIPQPIRNIW